MQNAKLKVSGLRPVCLLTDPFNLAENSQNTSPRQEKIDLSRVRQEVGGRRVAILEERHEKPRNFLPVPFCSHLS